MFETTLGINDKKNLEKDYVFILKRLVIHSRATRTLPINFPDTCCLIQGESKYYIYSQEDKIYEH